ncbi:MAG: histidine--tRNA ligase [Bryobacterales bacterium]|nr:histidine--tRNA ligase [Bryobacterales bacterium]
MIKAVKGTRDILPPASGQWAFVETRVRDIFGRYRYAEIRTPVFEESELFRRGVGEETDIVSKEMYTFSDRDGSSITLRPENTASVMRAYIEHRLDQLPGIQKLYYMGPMFRRERPQKGRYRQFHQIGAEVIGSERPEVDGEVITMVFDLLQATGVKDFQILLNSVGCSECRPAFLAKLRDALNSVKSHLCQDCQRRSDANPLRVLDCKVPADQHLINLLPSILDSHCQRCREHFDVVKGMLSDLAIPFIIYPRLVRGLDYYMRTTFEFTQSALGSQNSILGGGRYDGLAAQLGSRVPAPGIGFSIGQDRLMMALEEEFGNRPSVLDVFIAPLGASATRLCSTLAHTLRGGGASVEVGFDAKLKRALELAHKLNARYTLIVGDDEVRSGQYLLKEMSTGSQELVSRQHLLSKLSIATEHGI